MNMIFCPNSILVLFLCANIKTRRIVLGVELFYFFLYFGNPLILIDIMKNNCVVEVCMTCLGVLFV